VAEDRATRRLAAILSADVVGYSRLMEADEAGTLAMFRRHRSELVDPTIARFGGRIVNTGGDSLLCEFPSVVDALQCAVEIQSAMPQRNADLPEMHRMQFRIGINLGDVIVEGGDIFGDGVNVAARLEALAAPGSVCVSGNVHEQTVGRLPYAFTDLGEQTVKNIGRPIRAWRVQPDGSRSIGPDATSPALPLPDKPSIAVLPFTNMSGDPEQEYFADGMTEDIITELSRFRWLFVISRNSSFAFKGQSPDIRVVGSKLGVRYVVEGSIRRAGNRVRITAQLIDATTNEHIWAERYDRDLEDIFTVQDEVTHAIVTTLEPQLAVAERQRARRKPVSSLGAWECYQRGLWHLYRMNADDSRKALDLLERAIGLDPESSSAHAGLAFALYYHVLFGFSTDRGADLAKALEQAKAAVALDQSDAFAFVAAGRVYLVLGDPPSAIEAADRAIALNPSYALAHFGRAHALWHAGRPAEAIESHNQAMRLSPNDPLMWAIMASKSIALTLLDRAEEAANLAGRAKRQPNSGLFANIAELAALGKLGRTEDCRRALEEARRTKPDISISYIEQSLPITEPVAAATFAEALRRAGMPE
jgi:adenylate cyclase